MTPDTAEDILRRSFENMISKRYGIDPAIFTEESKKNGYAWIYEAMKEIASLAWEAGREFEKEEDRSFVRFIPRVSKDDFIKGLFP